MAEPVTQAARSAVTAVTITPSRPRLDPAERARLQRRARLLAWGGNAWHFAEFAIALAAGIAAGSIALIGFGVDSLIEVLAGAVVVWLFTGKRIGSHTAERRAQQAISISFALLAVYVTVEALRTLAAGHHPAASWVGIGLAAFTAVTMPLLARAKRRVGHALGSSATVSEAQADLALCLPLRRALGRPRRQRGVRPVVGRSPGSACDRRHRRPRGRPELARPSLQRRLLLTS